MGGGVAQLLDDGGEEEGECVEWQGHGVEAQPVKPALVVGESGAHVGPGKGLVVGCVRGVLEARIDVGALWLREEGCGGWVVVDEEVGEEGDDDCEESFLWFCQYVALGKLGPEEDIRG